MIGGLRLGTTLVSALLLIAVNAMPIIGVAFWGWSLMMVLVLYWMESGIVGVINVFKIARAQGSTASDVPIIFGGARMTVRMSGIAANTARGAIIGFFILHYGIFWMVHGVFVFMMPLFAGLANPKLDPASPSFGLGPMDFGPLPLDGLLLGGVLLTASHVVSYHTNFIGRGEYLRVSPQVQMLSVYGRVVVLHVTIIGGAVVIGMFGTPLAALVLLIGAKTVLDLFLHLREHRPPERATG